MTFLKTTALLVLGAAICCSFADGRGLLQGPSDQATATAISAPLPDPSASATASNATSSDDTFGTATLPPFYAVRSCVPFTVFIAAPTNASTDGNGTLVIDADEDVIDNIDVSLSNGVLALSISDGFETNNSIKCTITPGNSIGLSHVQNFGIGDLVVGPGFSASRFTVASTGVGNAYVFGLTTGTARVISMGSSTVLLNGNVSDGGSLEVGGTSKVYLTGAIGGTLAVNLGGISTTYVQGLPGTAIKGSVEGLAKVLFTAGTCSVQSPFQSILGSPFGDPCTRVQAGGAPSFTPSWSCGLQVEGESQCTSGAGSTGTFAPVVPTPTAVLGSSTGPVTRTVSTPGGSVTTSTFTSGPGASASSGGLVAGNGFPAFGSFQSSFGGMPPMVTPLAAPGAGAVSNLLTPVDLSIPTTSSGMSVVRVQCLDPSPLNVL
ncbi:hypothetical protein V8C86DRAFT_1034806 [Haematococcus lacustris]